MQRCKKCDAILLPGANFCHKCGFSTKVEEEQETVVQNEPVQQSLFEGDESAIIEEISSDIPTSDFYNFESNDTIEFDIKNKINEEEVKEAPKLDLEFSVFKNLFFEALRNRVLEEHNPILYSDYVERFYRSDFQKVMQSSIELWQEEVKRMKSKNETPEKILAFQEKLLNKWLNYFIIKECSELNEVYFSEKILKYDEIDPIKVNLEKMIEDFLELNVENNIKVYKNFLTMPPEKLETAIKSFASIPRSERIFFIADSSISGTCKEGFAMSNLAIYWKAPLEKAQRIEYNLLTSVKKHKDWVEINEQFFNIHKTLNMRLLRLLKTMIQHKLF